MWLLIAYSFNIEQGVCVKSKIGMWVMYEKISEKTSKKKEILEENA